MYRLSAYLYGTVKARVPAEALIIRDLNSLGYPPLPAVNYLILEKPKPGSGLRFCDSRALAPRSFNNTTVASDRESQIASLTPVSSLGGSIKDDESIAAANENGIAMAFTGIRHFKH